MKKIIQWTEIICRYFICVLMLVYGIVKLFRLQFSIEYYLMDMPLGSLNGTQLTWAFYDFHPAYQIIIGVAEIAIGLLVLFPGSSILGVLLFVPLSFNIMLLNFMFGIAALPTSVSLFIAGCVLFAIYFKNYVSFFSITTSTVVKRKFKAMWAPLLAILTGCILATFVIYHNYFAIKNDKSLEGKWTVVDDESFNTIYFEKGDLLVIKTHTGNMLYGRYFGKENSLQITGKNLLANMGNFTYKFLNDSLLQLNNGKHNYALKSARP